jgi:uncharacterized Zn finger protein
MARNRSRYDDDWWMHEPSSPISVEGGLKAKSQRGKFVTNWWASRWLGALTTLMDSGRLGRGRSYARQGQVLGIEIEAGHISARVQGSRRSPYRISIELLPLSDGQWDRVFDALSEQAIFAAQLLNGEMPSDIEEVFQAVQVPLFPSSRGDLHTDCSCPDWANPCKHIAAVYYLLGERFDQDPFLLFELRGRTKEQVAAALRERRAAGSTQLAEAQVPYGTEVIKPVEATDLSEQLHDFWAIGVEAEDVMLNLSKPKVNLALLKRLGTPGGLEPRGFQAQMERVYSGVTTRALDVAYATDDAVRDLEMSQEEQMAVLTMVEERVISVDEALSLLEALSG